jgi:hypothetical protein
MPAEGSEFTSQAEAKNKYTILTDTKENNKSIRAKKH